MGESRGLGVARVAVVIGEVGCGRWLSINCSRPRSLSLCLSVCLSSQPSIGLVVLMIAVVLVVLVVVLEVSSPTRRTTVVVAA